MGAASEFRVFVVGLALQFSIFMDENFDARWLNFFHGFTFGSNFILITSSLLYVHSLSSSVDEQRVRTVKAIVNNLHIWEERILIDKKLIIKVKFVSGFLMKTWCSIMAAVLYLHK